MCVFFFQQNALHVVQKKDARLRRSPRALEGTRGTRAAIRILATGPAPGAMRRGRFAAALALAALVTSPLLLECVPECHVSSTRRSRRVTFNHAHPVS